MPEGSFARGELMRLGAAVPRGERLAGYALYPALVRTVGVGSDREDEDRGGAAIGFPSSSAGSA